MKLILLMFLGFITTQVDARTCSVCCNSLTAARAECGNNKILSCNVSTLAGGIERHEITCGQPLDQNSCAAKKADIFYNDRRDFSNRHLSNRVNPNKLCKLTNAQWDNFGSCYAEDSAYALSYSAHKLADADDFRERVCPSGPASLNLARSTASTFSASTTAALFNCQLSPMQYYVHHDEGLEMIDSTETIVFLTPQRTGPYRHSAEKLMLPDGNIRHDGLGNRNAGTHKAREVIGARHQRCAAIRSAMDKIKADAEAGRPIQNSYSVGLDNSVQVSTWSYNASTMDYPWPQFGQDSPEIDYISIRERIPHNFTYGGTWQERLDKNNSIFFIAGQNFEGGSITGGTGGIYMNHQGTILKSAFAARADLIITDSQGNNFERRSGKRSWKNGKWVYTIIASKEMQRAAATGGLSFKLSNRDMKNYNDVHRPGADNHLSSVGRTIHLYDVEFANGQRTQELQPEGEAGRIRVTYNANEDLVRGSIFDQRCNVGQTSTVHISNSSGVVLESEATCTDGGFGPSINMGSIDVHCLPSDDYTITVNHKGNSPSTTFTRYRDNMGNTEPCAQGRSIASDTTPPAGPQAQCVYYDYSIDGTYESKTLAMGADPIVRKLIAPENETRTCASTGATYEVRKLIEQHLVCDGAPVEGQDGTGLSVASSQPEPPVVVEELIISGECSEGTPETPETPAPGETLSQASISSAGVGCSDNECLWVVGDNFGKDSGGNFQQITLTIKSCAGQILEEVPNKVARNSQNMPGKHSLSHRLTGPSLGVFKFQGGVKVSITVPGNPESNDSACLQPPVSEGPLEDPR